MIINCGIAHRDTGRTCVKDVGHTGPWHSSGEVLWLASSINPQQAQYRLHQFIEQAAQGGPRTTAQQHEVDDILAGLRYITRHYDLGGGSDLRA